MRAARRSVSTVVGMGLRVVEVGALPGLLDAWFGKLLCGVPVGGIRKAGPAVQGGDCCQVYGNGGSGQGMA